MRTLLLLGVAGCMLAVATNSVLAQHADPNADSNPTWATVAVLLGRWQETKEETVRKQIVLTLERMGVPVAQPLARVMEDEFRLAFASETTEEEKQKHLNTVIIAAKILGKQGNVIVRDDYVTEILLAFTHEARKVAGTVQPVGTNVRVAAIDALGNVFAQKAVFLVLQSPNELTREKNKEAQTAVEGLRNETQDLKKRITLLVAAMKDKDAAEALKEAAKARDLVLATRNLHRKFKVYQKLGFIMSELEPPIGKEKDMNMRIVEAVADIEANLRDVWAPPPASGKSDAAPGKIDPNKAAAAIHAGALAEQKADELCDEMDDLVRRVDGWLQMNDRTRKVILSFQDALRSRRETPTIVIICATEALGRVYGNRD